LLLRLLPPPKSILAYDFALPARHYTLARPAHAIRASELQIVT